MSKRDPINPTTNAARQMARALLVATRFGALAVTHPDTHTPYVARVAMLWQDGALLTLISTLSLHTQALAAYPDCAALIGEPENKGDPLTHPRMTLLCKAQEIDKTDMRDTWLARIPKAKLYYDFSDFRLYRLSVKEAHLNGGFGKAFHLTPEDLAL